MPITTTIDPPLPGDSPEVFDAKAFAAWAALAGLGAEINASSAEMTTKVSQAAGSATAAANSANAADASKNAADASKTAADASKNAAAASASTATTKASEADASKIAAAASATTASNAATAADASKTSAAGSATTATTKAGEASASATTASNAATTATTKAGEASNSATTATTKAGEASASASAAEQAKLDAQAAAQSAAGGGEPTIIAGTTGQYWRGDKTWQTLNSAVVGLGNVNNTSDANKPVSTAQQTALDGKADASHTHADATTSASGLMSGADKTKLNGVASGATANATDAQLRDRSTHTGSQAISTITGLQTALDGKAATAHTHSYTAADVGLGNVNNTSDASKPVSTAQQAAMDVISRGAYNTVSGGVIDLSLASGKFAMTVNGAVTVSFSNAHATYREAVLIELTYTSGTVTWPASIAWKGGTPPALTAGKKTWITLYRSSAGTQYVPAVSHEV